MTYGLARYALSALSSRGYILRSSGILETIRTAVQRSIIGGEQKQKVLPNSSGMRACAGSGSLLSLPCRTTTNITRLDTYGNQI